MICWNCGSKMVLTDKGMVPNKFYECPNCPTFKIVEV